MTRLNGSGPILQLKSLNFPMCLLQTEFLTAYVWAIMTNLLTAVRQVQPNIIINILAVPGLPGERTMEDSMELMAIIIMNYLAPVELILFISALNIIRMQAPPAW